jgi:hypothetical protein
MAQDLLADFNALHNQPANAIGTLIAPMVLRGGHRMIAFPSGIARAAYFKKFLSPLYNGLGITVNVIWTMPSASGAPRFLIAFERHDVTFSYLGANFANTKTLTLTAPTGANLATYASLTFADGAEIGGLLKSEEFRLSVTRDHTDGVAETLYVSSVVLTNTG